MSVGQGPEPSSAVGEKYSRVIPETAGLACSREGEEVGIFVTNPGFSVTFATCRANESKALWKAVPWLWPCVPLRAGLSPGEHGALSGGQDGAAAPT